MIKAILKVAKILRFSLAFFNTAKANYENKPQHYFIMY